MLVLDSRTLAKVLENQGEILHRLSQLTSQVMCIENWLKEIEEQLVEKFDVTHEKAFLKV